MTESQPATVTYWAISVFNSRTFWLNTAAALVAILSAAEVVTIIPLRFMPLVAAIVAVANLYLRAVTVRPVAFIAPGETKAVVVAKLTPPAPPVVTD